MSRDETRYDRLGGREGVAAVVDEFYDRVLGDDRVNGYFEGVDMDDLRAHQTAFVAVVAGAPDDYDGEGMREAHAHLGIDGRDFDIVVGHLDDALAAEGAADADRAAMIEEVRTLEPAIVDA